MCLLIFPRGEKMMKEKRIPGSPEPKKEEGYSLWECRNGIAELKGEICSGCGGCMQE